jgi:hypothetical protein
MVDDLFVLLVGAAFEGEELQRKVPLQPYLHGSHPFCVLVVCISVFFVSCFRRVSAFVDAILGLYFDLARKDDSADLVGWQFFGKTCVHGRGRSGLLSPAGLSSER